MTSAEAYSERGVRLGQQGKLDEAISAFRHAIKLKPNLATTHFYLGISLQKQNKLDEAIACYRKTLALQPDFMQAYGNLGVALKQAGQLDEAIACYNKILELKPNSAETYCNLGSALLKQGRLEEAIAAFQKAIGINANYAEAHYNLGSALLQQNITENGILALQAAVQIAPNFAQAHYNLGIVCEQTESFAEAIVSYRKALSLRTDYAEANYSLYKLLLQRGNFAEARQINDEFEKFSRDETRLEAAIYLVESYLKSGLHQIAKDKFLDIEETVYARRSRLTAKEAEILYGSFLFSVPFLRDDRAANANFFKLVGLNYSNAVIEPNLSLEKSGRDLGVPKVQQDSVVSLPRERQNSQHSAILHSPLKIGFISKHFNRHSVGWCSVDFIRELSHITPSLYCYVTGQLKEDDLTREFQQFATKFYQPKNFLTANPVREITDRLLADELDVLVDMDSMMTVRHAQIFHARPAEICISWPGFEAPFISASNYFLCDWHTHPTGVESNYLEQLVRLPDSHLSVAGFKCNAIDRVAVRKTFGIAPEQIAYAFFAPGLKFNRASANAHVQILKHVPDSVLLYKGKGDMQIIQATYQEACDRLGVSCDRIKFLPLTKTEEEHRACFTLADISLDSYPYNGGTHNLEALWANLPLVTRVGDQSFARMGYSFLKTLGIDAGIAFSWEEYVAWGIRLGRDHDLRHSVRERLMQSKQPESLSPLWNPRKYAKDLYAILEELLSKQMNAEN